MDIEVIQRQLNGLLKWKAEVQPILDFVSAIMPQTDEEKAEFAHQVERRREARAEYEAHHSDEPKGLGDSQPAEADPVTGKPIVSTDGQLPGDGTGNDKGAAPQGDQAPGGDGAADANNAAGEASQGQQTASQAG